jgi:hypothetical protein
LNDHGYEELAGDLLHGRVVDDPDHEPPERPLSTTVARVLAIAATRSRSPEPAASRTTPGGGEPSSAPSPGVVPIPLNANETPDTASRP